MYSQYASNILTDCFVTRKNKKIPFFNFKNKMRKKISAFYNYSLAVTGEHKKFFHWVQKKMRYKF